MQKTNIEYLTHTWNPIAMRCDPVSAGCANCWHLSMARRHAANPKLSDALRSGRAGGAPLLMVGELNAPLGLRKPAVIGVQFMGDLFHESVSLEILSRVMVAAANTMNARHTFVFLTKRPAVMAGFFEGVSAHVPPGTEHPPSNFWLGVSVEDQKTADERIPILLDIPAAVRFVNYEPALGPVDWYPWVMDAGRSIDWLIAGAETGPKKRPADLEWLTRAADCCRCGLVPFFFKRDGDGNRELDGILYEGVPDAI